MSDRIVDCKPAIQSRAHVCSLDAAPMHAGAEWLRHYEIFWNQRLDHLEALLRQDASRQHDASLNEKASRKHAQSKSPPPPKSRKRKTP